MNKSWAVFFAFLTLTVFVPLDDEETEKLASCVRTPEAKAKIGAMVATIRAAEMAFGGSGKTRLPSFYERGVDFVVPLLCVQENGNLFEFEETFLLERQWKLSEKDAALSPNYNPLERPTGKAGYLDVGAKGEIESGEIQEPRARDFVGELHQHVLQLGGVGDWSLERLIAWLDRQLDRREDIPAHESTEFLRKVLRGLMARFGITEVSVLALDRFRLRDEIATRIQQHRDSERKVAFQMFLLPESPLTVSEDRMLNFKTMSYEPSEVYSGGFQFKKHYFGPKPGELRELTQSRELTEEFKCAQLLDGLPEVQCWVRNLARRSTSFRLQTSRDWFYPDFICQLTDGRVLVVEYKGKHLYDTADAEEKRAIGAVWESRSGGRCRFVMPTEGNFSVIANAVR